MVVCCTFSNAFPIFVIDDFDYATSEAARAVWKASGPDPVVMAATGEWGDTRALVLPIHFTEEVQRRYWDGTVSLDLSNVSVFEMEVYVSDTVPISYLTLYFHSGEAWMGKSITVSATGWQEWKWQKSEFTEEGAGFDWSTVDRIRLSPWKQAVGECFLALDRLIAYTPEICVVRGDLSDSQYSANVYADLMSGILARWDLPYSQITDTEVIAGGLEGAKVALFPYSDQMPESELDRIESFIDTGGKVMVFFVCPQRLASRLGFVRGQYIQQTYAGQFSAFRFNAPDIEGLPERVMQNSWNIYTALPQSSDAQVIAYWEDSNGVPSIHPAWLASSTGTFMSHVLMSDDLSNKELLMLALLGHYRPDSWEEAASAALERMGRIGDLTGYENIVEFIRTGAQSTPRVEAVEESLALADARRDSASEALSLANYSEAIREALAGREKLLEAYYDCQSPQAGEFRAFWEHSGLGAYPGDWERSILNLKEHGFNAIVPNMLWAGSARYNSGILPHAEEYEQYGDQIAQCVEAAHRHGIEVHVWKVNWNFGSRAPQAWGDAMRAANRTQVSVSGEGIDWLCPSHPDNLTLERDSLLEVVRNYAVDGIHFDYIRYPDSPYCYCDGCRARFEAYRGVPVDNWPLDCYQGALAAEYRQWRMDQITNLVRAVSEGAHAIRPGVKISAAVFSNYPDCAQTVGQDWVSWIDAGYLDFVCPMDYTNDFQRFEYLVTTQAAYVGGRIPLYPGLGVTAGSSSLGSDDTIAQILIARRLGVPGFIVFNYSQSLAETLLPDLSRGITSDIESGYLSVH